MKFISWRMLPKARFIVDCFVQYLCMKWLVVLAIFSSCGSHFSLFGFSFLMVQTQSTPEYGEVSNHNIYNDSLIYWYNVRVKIWTVIFEDINGMVVTAPDVTRARGVILHTMDTKRCFWVKEIYIVRMFYKSTNIWEKLLYCYCRYT